MGLENALTGAASCRLQGCDLSPLDELLVRAGMRVLVLVHRDNVTGFIGEQSYT